MKGDDVKSFRFILMKEWKLTVKACTDSDQWLSNRQTPLRSKQTDIIFE